MKIRNPFKDYLGRFKDDATKTEKTVWTLVLIYFGYALGHILVSLILENIFQKQNFHLFIKGGFFINCYYENSQILLWFFSFRCFNDRCYVLLGIWK